MASKPTYSPAASEALRALTRERKGASLMDDVVRAERAILDALPLIADCIEAAEAVYDGQPSAFRETRLESALAALRDSLGAKDGDSGL